MSDITYCYNRQCPFEECEHHLVHAPREGMVSIAALDSTCRDYISYLVDEISRLEEDKL